MARTSVADELETFDSKYGAVITVALQLYSEHMRKEAKRIRDEYDIKVNPGLGHAARAIEEAADSGDAALEAYGKLTGND